MAGQRTTRTGWIVGSWRPGELVDGLVAGPGQDLVDGVVEHFKVEPEAFVDAQDQLARHGRVVLAFQVQFLRLVRLFRLFLVDPRDRHLRLQSRPVPNVLRPKNMFQFQNQFYKRVRHVHVAATWRKTE